MNRKFSWTGLSFSVMKTIKQILFYSLLTLSLGCAQQNNDTKENSALSSTQPSPSQETSPQTQEQQESAQQIPEEPFEENQNEEAQLPTEPDPQVPRQVEQAVMLDHKYFQVKYLTQQRLPKYVRYVLTGSNLRKRRATRSDRFQLDSMLIELNIQPVLPHDYFGSGYDRGHMAPSADFLWDQKANDESFVMSNIAPQTNRLNTGSWMQLEDKVRRWACAEERLIVIAGPVIDSNLRKMRSGVSIPKRFFKIVLDDTPPRKAVGFVFNNHNDSLNSLERIKLPAATVSKLINENFKNEFPTKDQHRLLENPHLEDWREESCFRRRAL